MEAFKDKPQFNIQDQPGKLLSGVVRHLLKEFTDKTDALNAFLDNYRNLYDDRMFVSAAYGLAGPMLSDEVRDKVLSLAAWVDRGDDTFDSMDGYAYTPDEIKARTQSHPLILWKSLGGQYTFTDYSNIYLYRDSKFRNKIAPTDIPFIYDRMLIQALLYQASLRLYDASICRETKRILKGGELQTIRERRAEFIRFTNQYWFHNLTEQMQGKEIFRLQQDALGLKEHYEIIKDELERTDEYLLSKLSDQFAFWGLVIAFVAIYYSLLPILADMVKGVSTQSVSLWQRSGEWLSLPCLSAEWWGFIFWIVLIPGAFFWSSGISGCIEPRTGLPT